MQMTDAYLEVSSLQMKSSSQLVVGVVCAKSGASPTASSVPNSEGTQIELTV